MVEIATRSKSLLQMQLSLWPLGFESRRQNYLEDVVYLNLSWCDHGGGSAVAFNAADPGLSPVCFRNVSERG